VWVVFGGPCAPRFFKISGTRRRRVGREFAELTRIALMQHVDGLLIGADVSAADVPSEGIFEFEPWTLGAQRISPDRAIVHVEQDFAVGDRDVVLDLAHLQTTRRGIALARGVGWR